MKKFVSFVLALAAVVSCSQPQPDVPSVITEVKVVPSDLTIQESDTETLKVEVTPNTVSYTQVTWSSDDPSVAKISKKGLLTAIGAGETTIHATIDGVVGDCKVTVTKEVVAVTGVELDQKEMVIGINDPKTLKATVKPAGATNTNLTWESSAPEVAKVEAGVVTGLKKGEAVITVTTEDGGFSETCNVTVIEADIISIAFVDATADAKIVRGGGSATLTVEFNPSNTEAKQLEWSSSDTGVAVVESTVEGVGNVTFSTEKYGPVIITATSKVNPEIVATQAYFVKGDAPLYTKPEVKIYAGKKEKYTFNGSAYPGATKIVWKTGEKEVEGEEVMLAVDDPGRNEIVLSAEFGEIKAVESFSVSAELWYINIDLPDEMGANNSAPVFSPDGKKAYIVTEKGKPETGNREVIEIDLEGQKIGWRYNLNQVGPTAADNGGHMGVNPFTGDIVCTTSTHIVCLTSTGSLKWAYNTGETNTARNPSLYSGCGAGFNNDGTVVFCCGNPKGLHAFDAATGELIDKVSSWARDKEGKTYNPESNQCQWAVYGNNKICIHLKTDFIVFYDFVDRKFVETGCILTGLPKESTDMSSAAVTEDQKSIFFSGKATIRVDLDKKEITSEHIGGTGWHMAPAITESGFMYQAQSYYANQAAVIFYDIHNQFSEGCETCVYSNGCNPDAFKFSQVCCDREGNCYFTIHDTNEHKLIMYRATRKADGSFDVKELASDTEDGAFYGDFNMGNGYLIAVSGSKILNGKIRVRCIDAERGHSWSGHGGDPCSSKNANIAYR